MLVFSVYGNREDAELTQNGDVFELTVLQLLCRDIGLVIWGPCARWEAEKDEKVGVEGELDS